MGWPHKKISFDSEDPESTLSGSETRETRPGWPPDDMCADSTRYKGLFDEREREGFQLLSPVFQRKVLKLQRDLEEAKAESRYLRARPVDSQVVDTNRSRFTTTPVPRIDGVSDWDQYREVFEAIVASNGWDDLTAALQLIAHLDGEALNVALLVPDDQRKRPGVLVETLTAHYTSPGRLAKHRRQFEQMTRPPGEDPAAFAIALETLARRAFVDVDPAVRLQLVRDKFITGHSQLALRRHLDSAGPDTTISSIVDKCRVWESHEERNSRPRVECEPGTSRGVFQVRKQIRDDHNEGPAEPDSNSSDFGNLTNRLRELVQQPVLDGSGPIDIGHLLRQLLPIDDEVREIGQPTSETESVDNCVSGKRGLIRGGGLVTRISDDTEPQRDDYSNYCDRPEITVDSVILNSSRTQWSHDRESDDSEDEETSPTEEYWAIPDDGWTLVERSHGKPRGISDGHRNRTDDSDGKLDNVRLRYDELDDIMDTKVLSNYRKEVVRITDTFPETTSDTRTVIVDVKPIVNEQPDRLEVISMDKTDGRDNCLVNMVLAPRGRESEYSEIRMQPVELLPESRVVVTNEMAEEITTGGLPDGCDVITRMSAMEAIANDDVIIGPVPRLLSVEVMEQIETDEITWEEYTDGQLVKDETTKLGVSTELVDLPQKWLRRSG